LGFKKNRFLNPDSDRGRTTEPRPQWLQWHLACIFTSIPHCLSSRPVHSFI